jgi:hypothetical protein
MTKTILPLLTLLFLITVANSVFAFGTRMTDTWSYYHFDGTTFTSGPAAEGSISVAVREKVRPAFLKSPQSSLDLSALPDGTGVIAGICYLQSSGGKLSNGNSSGFKPYPHVPVTISSDGKQFVTVETDDKGYFVAVLPIGIYSIGSGHFTAEFAVQRGITTLVPLRAGKRMVD